MKPSQKNTFFSTLTVHLVNFFGSWISILLHTLLFIGWFYFQLKLELLLVIVSLEAIYLCIFILMAENVEAAQKEKMRAQERKHDLGIVKQDIHVDEIALKKLKKIEKQLNTLHNLVEDQLVKNKKQI